MHSVILKAGTGSVLPLFSSAYVLPVALFAFCAVGFPETPPEETSPVPPPCTVQIPEAPAPDLCVLLTASRDGQEALLEATITNNGGASVETTLKFYQPTDPAMPRTGEITGSGTNIPILQNAQTETLTRRQALPATAGDHYYTACVDTITDDTNTDNDCSSPAVVTATPPDLSVSLELIRAGPFVLLTAVAANSGDAESPSTNLKFYQPSDPAMPRTGEITGSVANIPRLQNAQTETVTHRQALPMAAGNYYYAACVDSISGGTSMANDCAVSAAVNVTVSAAGAVDTDGDGLIEIDNAAMLNNIRYNPAGDSYDENDDGTCSDNTLTTRTDCEAAAETWTENNLGSVIGCPASGCRGYELTNNISLTAPLTVPWIPIPAEFTGLFDGNKLTITGLTISGSGTSVGFFTDVSGTVKNLTINSGTGSGVTSSSTAGTASAPISIGTIAGWLKNGGTIDNVSAASPVTAAGGEYDYAGGLAGQNNGTVENSSASGDVNGGAGRLDNAGGLVGWNDGAIIRSSYAEGNVFGGPGNSDRVGGLVGWSKNARIDNSYAKGNADGGDGATDQVGGLVGENDGIIYNSYAEGDAHGGAGGIDNVGGLVGFLRGFFIKNSYSVGNAHGGDGDNDYAGGFVGYCSALIENSYAVGRVAGGAGVSDFVGGLAGNVIPSCIINKSYASGNTHGGDPDASPMVAADTTDEVDQEKGIANSITTNRIDDFSSRKTEAQLQTSTNETPMTAAACTATGAAWDSVANMCTGAVLYKDWDTHAWDFGMTFQYPALRSYEEDAGGNVVDGDLLCGQQAPRAQCP